MGNWSYTNFQAYLKTRLGNRDDVESPVNYLGIWTNSAYLDLTTKNRFWGLKRNFDFPQLRAVDSTKSTSDGVAYVAAPTDTLIIYQVRDTTSDSRLRRISFEEYTNKSGTADTDAEGVPTLWTRFGTYVYVYLTPDATYALNIFYRKIPAVLSGVGDTTAIDASWDSTILELATIKGYTWLQQYDKAEMARKQLLADLADKMGIYDKEDNSRRDIMTPDPNYYDFTDM